MVQRQLQQCLQQSINLIVWLCYSRLSCCWMTHMLLQQVLSCHQLVLLMVLGDVALLLQVMRMLLVLLIHKLLVLLVHEMLVHLAVLSGRYALARTPTITF